MSAPEPIAFRKAQDGGCAWDDVARLNYKEEGSAPFKAISRQTLFSSPHLAGELRYFEIEPGGYSTLERHEHAHAVMILRGRGTCLVDGEVREIDTRDLVSIAPWSWHQFRASRGEALGFLCLVNSLRDKPQLPTQEQLATLRENPAIAAFFDAEPK